MEEESEFLELLRVQDSLDMISKSELIDWAKKHRMALTDRKLTSFMTEGLLPKTARIGSRGGAYPAIAKDQLKFVLRWRSRGTSVTAIKELLPVWRFMTSAVRRHEVDLAELEDLVQQTVHSDQALHTLPNVIQDALPCPNCKSGELSDIKFRFKDDTVRSRGANDDVSFAVLFEETDGDGECTSMMIARITLPRIDEAHDPSTMVIRRKAATAERACEVVGPDEDGETEIGKGAA